MVTPQNTVPSFSQHQAVQLGREIQQIRATPVEQVDPAAVLVARCVYRAWQQDLWTHVDRPDPDVKTLYTVPSQTDREETYYVTRITKAPAGTPEWALWMCDCQAGQDNAPSCTHRAAVWIRLWHMNLTLKAQLPFEAFGRYQVKVDVPGFESQLVSCVGLSEDLLRLTVTQRQPGPAAPGKRAARPRAPRLAQQPTGTPTGADAVEVAAKRAQRVARRRKEGPAVAA